MSVPRHQKPLSVRILFVQLDCAGCGMPIMKTGVNTSLSLGKSILILLSNLKRFDIITFNNFIIQAIVYLPKFQFVSFSV